MGLGPYPDVTFSKAQKKADKHNAELADGIDPIAAREAANAKAAEAANVPTFKEFGIQYVNDHKAGWKNQKHKDQWEQSLTNYVYPILGDLTLPAITVDHVLDVVRPIWSSKHETASRIRGRIQKILSAAKAKKFRDGPNPAAWAENLEHLLPKINRARRIKHFRALPYADAPTMMAKLRKLDTIAAKAARFVILTACRTTEMREAAWSEFDLVNRTWLVPAARIKAAKPHRVPLCDEAVEILMSLKPLSKVWAFPGRRGKPLSDGAVLMLLGRAGYREFTTAHGLRSTFRMWAAECTNYPREVCEQALAHSEENEVEQAYMRSDHFGKRKNLMADWAAFLAPRDDAAQSQAAE